MTVWIVEGIVWHESAQVLEVLDHEPTPDEMAEFKKKHFSYDEIDSTEWEVKTA